MPYFIDEKRRAVLAPFLQRALFRQRFSEFSAGGGVAPSLFTFTRGSSGHSVRSGTSSLIITGVSSNNVPRFGRFLDANRIGIYIEPSRQNIIANARRPDLLPAGTWTSTTAGQTDATGGTSAYRTQAASGGTGRYHVTGSVTGTYTGSAWVAKGSGTGSHQFVVGFNSIATGGTLGAAWTRESLTATLAAQQCYHLPNYGGDGTGISGGVAAGARDTLMDFLQLETGKYPTSAIITTGSALTRSAERLLFDGSAAQAMRRNGRLYLYLRLYALAASTELGSGEGWLCYWQGGGGGVLIDPTSRYVYGYNGANESQSANAAISWARHDELEFILGIGNGRTSFEYAKNAGSFSTISFSVRDNSWGSVDLHNGLDILNVFGGGQFPAILTDFAIYRN